MRDSIPTITLYKEDGLLGDKLFFHIEIQIYIYLLWEVKRMPQKRNC